MTIELNAGMRAASPLGGHSFRPVDPDRDYEQLHALDAASFVVNPDYHPESLDAFREEHLEAHDFVASLSIVAYIGDRITGFLLSRNFTVENAGFIDLTRRRARAPAPGPGDFDAADRVRAVRRGGAEQSTAGRRIRQPAGVGAVQARRDARGVSLIDTYERSTTDSGPYSLAERHFQAHV